MASRPERPSRVLLYVSALTAAAAAIRFATLDQQSFWLDELVTVSLLRRDFGDALGQIPETEATPYLYYVLAWPWTRLVGFGEVGLRSLSALVGTAVIPITYAAGATLVTRRAGLIAAALVSVSPMLVWYSQEARSYGLLSFLGAGTVLLFARALRSSRSALVGWAVVSALALATHYFAAVLVSAEAVWLLYALRPRRAALVASLLPAAALVAHVPLVLGQRGNAEAVADASFGSRAAGLPKNLAVAYSFPAEALSTTVVAGLLLLGLVLLSRASPRDQLGAFVAGSLALCAIALPLVLALLGADYVTARNGILAVVPAAVFFGAGYAANRLGVAAAAVLCVLLAAISVAPALDAQYGRTDWRGAARGLGAPTVERAIVTTPFMSRALWAPYVADLTEPGTTGARVREIVVLGLATEGGFSAGPVRPPEGTPLAPPRGFRLLEFERHSTYSLARYGSRTPRLVSIDELAGLRLTTDQQPGVLLQGPDR